MYQKFLHFSVIVADFDEKMNCLTTFIYYYNPFDDIIHKKKLEKYFDVFPDKLKNVLEYNVQYCRTKFSALYTSTALES